MSPRATQLARPGPKAAARRGKSRRRLTVPSETPAPVAALGDRIASSLARRPMSAPTLAALLDAKELTVSIQLAAMAAAGEVTAGPAADVGLRNRVWSRARR